MPKPEKTGFDEFLQIVRDAVEKNAKEKGYNETGISGKNELYEFINGTVGPNDAHALGEIIYKAIRFSKKRDKADLVKIAAWAYLIYNFGD